MYLIAVTAAFLWHFIMVSSGPLQQYDQCKLETNTSTIEMIRLATFQLPETEDGKCYIACIMKVSGMINETGHFDANRTMELVKDYVEDEKKLLQVEALLMDCGNDLNESGEIKSNICDTSTSLIQCITRRQQEDLERSKRTITIPLNVTLPPLTIVLAQLSLL